MCYNQHVSYRKGELPHIGLNAHLLSLTETYRSAGINSYISQLLRRLPAACRAEIETDSWLTAYLHEPGFTPPDGLEVERSRWDTRQPWRRIAWEQTRLAAISRRLDLLHGMAFATPLAAGCPTVVSVHDLSFMRHPAAFRRFNRIYLSLITRLSARRAAAVIVASQITRQDVMRLCGVPGERVVVAPDGVDETFCPADPAATAEFRRRKGLPDRFILYLGTLEPRKNLVRLIDAYARWRAAGPGAPGGPARLLIAGAKGWFYQRIFSRVQELNLADDVLFPGFVPAEELPWWYRAAAAFVYPSLFEGFGLPVLEAMACAAPVITTTAPALQEVAAASPSEPPAALLVDPEDTAALSAAIAAVLSDENLANQLRAAGLRRAARFSWTRTAVETARVYRDVLQAVRMGGAL
ncbi:MAG: glycosyltransferase family 4 protein [Chloroflexi bacterium]|nr:glycosyltransferase family 4 protein [Chloroflexota bacterium]